MKTASVRILLAAGLVSVFASFAAAEHRGFIVGGHREFRTFGSRHGFGNVVFPGVGNAPRLINPFGPHASFAQRLGATISGSPGFSGAPGFGHFKGGPVVVPYVYPVFVGNGYPEPPAYQQPPNVTIVMPPQAQAAPPVTIYQSFGQEPARSVIREYGPGEEPQVQTYQAPSREPSAAPAEAESVNFLIALKDHSVYSALAYWVEGDTLHYITAQGNHNQVSLDLVDRALSEKLNRGRKVEFRLPQR